MMRTEHLPGSSRTHFLLIMLGIVISIVCLVATTDYVMDDALITLRYSYNLGQIGQPIWNKADIDNPSMGYTTPLWMVVNAIPASFSDNRDLLIIVSRIFSFLALLGIICVLAQDINKCKLDLFPKVLITTAIFGQAGFAFHVNSGMETMLFSFLILLTVVTHYHRPNELWSVAFGTLAFLTRPEAALIVAIVVFDYLRKKAIRQVAIRTALFGSVVVVLLGFMLAYYGDILPNSFYVKQESGLSSASITQSVFFIVTVALPFLLLSVYGALSLKVQQSTIALVAAIILGVYYLTVSPLMNVLSRYQWPILVLLVYASIPAFENLVSRNFRFRKAILWGLGLTLAAINLGNFAASNYFAVTTGRAMSNLIEIGKALATYRTDNQWLVYHDAGAVCYFSDWNCYDTIGLNNRDVAKGITTTEQILSLDHSTIVMQNVDLGASNSATRVERFTVDFSQYGYEYVDSVVTLREEGNREFAVLVFARNTEEVRNIMSAADIHPDIGSQFFYEIYALARQLVKGR